MSKFVKWVNLKSAFEFTLTVIIPLLYLYNLFIIALNPFTVNFNLLLRLLGIAIAIFGLSFWILSMVNLGKSFGVLPEKQKKVKVGLYRYFNHPMYIGIWSCFLGLSLSNASWQGIVFLNLVITPLLFVRAYFEDRNLS